MIRDYDLAIGDAQFLHGTAVTAQYRPEATPLELVDDRRPSRLRFAGVDGEATIVGVAECLAGHQRADEAAPATVVLPVAIALYPLMQPRAVIGFEQLLDPRHDVAAGLLVAEEAGRQARIAYVIRDLDL